MTHNTCSVGTISSTYLRYAFNCTGNLWKHLKLKWDRFRVYQRKMYWFCFVTRCFIKFYIFVIFFWCFVGFKFGIVSVSFRFKLLCTQIKLLLCMNVNISDTSLVGLFIFWKSVTHPVALRLSWTFEWSPFNRSDYNVFKTIFLILHNIMLCSSILLYFNI